MMRYQQLSTPAQRLFDRGSKKRNEVTVPYDEAPESFATLVPESGYAETIYIRKDGQYYYVEISQTTQRPSFQAFLLRLGSLLGAIGLGTLAGYFVLTAED
ncbi:hypothetical protein ACFQL7_27685 [Halocatena marina]|uniref:Uncharacterized protein n=2 Tax=Halocatena marina TaxID=2934937 RepID=A0ABD5YYP9_9EURY